MPIEFYIFFADKGIYLGTVVYRNMGALIKN